MSQMEKLKEEMDHLDLSIDGLEAKIAKVEKIRLAYERDCDREVGDTSPLKDKILRILRDADWYFECSGYQNEHANDLQLETLQLEDPDTIIGTIVEAVREAGK